MDQLWSQGLESRGITVPISIKADSQRGGGWQSLVNPPTKHQPPPAKSQRDFLAPPPVSSQLSFPSQGDEPLARAPGPEGALVVT